MPMPTPTETESEAEFVGRCMEDDVMVEEYPGQKQRAAVCHSQYGDEYAASTPGRHAIVCLASKPGRVDHEAGTIEGISILTAGEAKGHGMMISEKTLEAAIVLLIGKSLPAYLSHAGAHGDRLLTEAGYFSGFYRDKEQIRARKFTALATFKKYEREKYDRLFEIAEKAPQTFGVSIVFEGQLFWEMRDGSETTMEVGLNAPENARFEVPTVRPLEITSADFVDTPAANGSLFRKVDTQPNSKEMKMETDTLEKPTATTELGEPANESASAHHVADEEPAAAAAPAPGKKDGPNPEPPAPKKTRKKKALAEQDEEDRKDEERGEEDEIAKEDQGEDQAKEDDDAEDRDDDEKPDADEFEEPDNEYQEKMRAAVEEVYSHMENAVHRLREVMDMTGVPNTREESADGDSTEMEAKVAELTARVEELMKLQAGTPPIPEKKGEAFTDLKDAKQHLISKHLDANPGDSRSTAVLAVAKTNPELFKNN